MKELGNTDTKSATFLTSRIWEGFQKELGLDLRKRVGFPERRRGMTSHFL